MIQASEQQRLKEAAAQKSNEETQRPGHVRVRRMINTEARSTTGGPPTLPESPKRARRTSHARATQPTTPIPRPVRNYRASTKYTLRSLDKKSNGAEPNKKIDAETYKETSWRYERTTGSSFINDTQKKFNVSVTRHSTVTGNQ